MIQFRILLEKLYQHRSNLETMLKVHETHCCGSAKAISEQYAECLDNIRNYELLVKKPTHDTDYLNPGQPDQLSPEKSY